MSVRRCRECGHVDGKLLDRKGIMAEYGVTEAVAEKFMRALPKVHQPAGVRKTYVRREAVEQLLAESTVAA